MSIPFRVDPLPDIPKPFFELDMARETPRAITSSKPLTDFAGGRTVSCPLTVADKAIKFNSNSYTSMTVTPNILRYV